MDKVLLTIEENRLIAKNIYKMRLSGDCSAVENVGQFVNIALDGFFLRRPISVHDFSDNYLDIIYKTVGAGTDYMTTLQKGTVLDVLTGLGNGYDTALSGQRPLLVGGGVGVPPLYALCKKLVSEGKDVCVILGFNTVAEIFCEQEFLNLGARVTVTTADGSYGVRGFVTDAMNVDYSYFYACGPALMLKAICKMSKVPGQLSLEERMGCGFGACMGCSIMTTNGAKRVCKDGPVFKSEEIIWAD